MSAEKKSDVIAAGTIITFSTGEYSDYSFWGPFRALREFDRKEVAEAFGKSWRRRNVAARRAWREEVGCEMSVDRDAFVPWLIRRRYIEDVEPACEWHIGSYGEFSP